MSTKTTQTAWQKREINNLKKAIILNEQEVQEHTYLLTTAKAKLAASKKQLETLENL